MVAPSKLIVEQLSSRSCNELLHPHSCRRAAFQNLWRFAWSNTKYYLPVALLHFIKHTLRGGFKLEQLWDALCYYTELIFGGLVNVCLISTSMCTLRQILGAFRLETLLFVPALIGGASIALMPRRVKHLQHTAIFQALIESLLMQRGNLLTHTLASSLKMQTLLFMCCSGVIMLGTQQHWHNGFWFLAPEALPPRQPPIQDVQYVVQGMRKYLLVGLAMDAFKALVSCMKSRHWHWQQLRLESMAWLGCYVGIYRSTLCYLQRHQNVSETLQQFLASFLGGLSFVCYPKLTILSYALLEAGRTLWNRCNKSKRKRFGYSDMLYPFALAYLIHNYVLQPNRVSGLTGIIIDSSTANYARNINKRLEQLLSDVRMV